MLKKLDKDLFENERIDEINFSEQLPAKLDSKLYIAIYRKIWATIRHDMHERIMAKRQELNIMSETEPLPQSEFVKIQNEVHDNFESVRNDIWRLMMEENTTEVKRPRKMMQKAYCTFATVAQFEGDFKPEEVVRSRWAD